MKRDAEPFVFVEEPGDTNDQFTGITSDFLEASRGQEGRGVFIVYDVDFFA